VLRQLDLVTALGFPREEEDHLSVRVPPAAARRVEALLRELGIRPGVHWSVIAPGASAASRRWPPDRFGAVGRALASRHHWRLLVTGDASERQLTATVAEAIGPAATDLGGRLALPELAALLARAPLLIANNSGPAHLAAAVGTPVVDVYALTNPQHTPWGVPSRVLTFPVPCAGCRRSVCPEGHHACLLGISAERVVAAAVELVTPRAEVPA
jgi:ADP-heptose:LPS heptosyltransferase